MFSIFKEMAAQVGSFRRKFPLVWKQLSLAVLAEETAVWRTEQLFSEREWSEKANKPLSPSLGLSISYSFIVMASQKQVHKGISLLRRPECQVAATCSRLQMLWVIPVETLMQC